METFRPPCLDFPNTPGCRKCPETRSNQGVLFLSWKYCRKAGLTALPRAGLKARAACPFCDSLFWKIKASRRNVSSRLVDPLMTGCPLSLPDSHQYESKGPTRFTKTKPSQYMFASPQSPSDERYPRSAPKPKQPARKGAFLAA